MSRLPHRAAEDAPRYPGFDVLDEAPHWDQATRELIDRRLDQPGPLRFVDEHETPTLRALVERLLGLADDGPLADTVVALVDERLAEGRTDGWSYADLPEDAPAWHRTLRDLDADAEARHGIRFADLSPARQDELLEAVRTAHRWQSLPAAEVWGLWMRYACAAFYSLPAAWNEIGFSGPAYPQGHKNLGVEARDPRDPEDHRPEQDPPRRIMDEDPQRSAGHPQSHAARGHAGARRGSASARSAPRDPSRPPRAGEHGEADPPW